VAQTLKGLVRQTAKLPRSAAPARKRRALLRTVRHARGVSKRRPCTAVRDLNRYRRILRSIKPKRGRSHRRANQKLAALGPASLQVTQRLLASKRTRRCGGGVKPSTRKSARTKVLSSNARGLKVRVQLPELHFVPKTGGGETWTQLVLDNTDTPSKPGSPGIPVVSSDFGVPDGAKLKVTSSNVTSSTLHGVDVYPAQPDPVDADTPPPNFLAGPFADRPFTLNGGAYSKDGPVPAKPAAGHILGTARDIRIGDLQVPAVQYSASSKTLKVLKSVDVKISFRGGPHTFSPELSSQWERPQREFTRSLLNGRFIRGRPFDILRRCGEEMLVITNRSTRAAADQFANARRAAGLRVRVVEAGKLDASQIGENATDIQAFIRGELTRFLCIHPSYITILGDDDLVATFKNTPNSIPSDLPYSMKDDTDELPDVAVGRIIGDDQTAVAHAIDKIVGYEDHPPGGPAVTSSGFYRHATIAAQFQDDNADGQENRTFVQFAETVRNGLVARGQTVDRVYHDSPTTTPLKFNDGTDLPDSLKKPTFAWDGTAADAVGDWNAGRFLMIHRDHGYSDGWGTPGVSTSDVQTLTNGALLPVLLSINCSSAAYDYDETSFVGESLVNSKGGSVGAFGDTRDSPTWHNTQIALGFVDALLPSILPSEGPSTKQRMGYALINGKTRLAGLAPPSGPGITGGDGDTRNELYLWHYFGDPSMQMWGGDPPPVISPAEVNAVFTTQGPPRPGGDPPPYFVNVSVPASLSGQTVSLLRDGQVIGKALVGSDGKAQIPATFGDSQPDRGELQVSLEPDGSPPVRAPVQGSTSLTQSCPSGTVNNNSPVTFRGSLSPGFAGANIVRTYTRPDGTSFERTVQTDANGDWTDTIQLWPTFTGNDPNHGAGTWKVRSRFNGDSTHAPSSTGDCTFQVNDNT
jgi:hypothetical protein